METKTTINPLLQLQAAIQLCNVASDHNPIQDIGTLTPDYKIVWNSGDPTDPNYFFVATNKTSDVYVLAIRGSVVSDGIFTDWDAFVDWVLEDLDEELAYWPFASTPMPCISLGAYGAFTAMLLAKNSLGAGESLLQFLLANTTNQNKQLIITGHSLGGNLANVYASYYVETLKKQQISANNVSLFTFAAPASGNSDFANDLDSKITNAWHYANTNDAVPGFPVAQGLVDTSNFYEPNKPDAAAITISFQDKQMTLQQVFLLLGEIIFPAFGYQQPKRNYSKVTAPLDSKFITNTIEDWLGQAGTQHQLSTYAKCMGITLPPVHAVHTKKRLAQMAG